jgi:hypothetical protein
MSSLLSTFTRVWERFFGYVAQRNERAVEKWGSSLQYKRRYTNPDDAIRARRLP